MMAQAFSAQNLTATLVGDFSNAGDGIVQQVKHNIRGHGSYLLAQTDPRALWYYFPVVLTIKLSPGLGVLLAAVAILQPRTLLNGSCGIRTRNGGAADDHRISSQPSITTWQLESEFGRLYMPLLTWLCHKRSALSLFLFFIFLFR